MAEAEETQQSVEELTGNLTGYREQLAQVETLLLSDHTNAELREMYDNLAEVIQLTEDLLQEAGIAVPPAGADADAAAGGGPSSSAAAGAGCGVVCG
jgi:hypothetical protein